MNNLESQKGLIKEILIVAIVILILAYFNIDIQVAAEYIKSFSG